MNKRVAALIIFATAWLVLTISGTGSDAAAQAGANVVINEMMYHPASGVDDYEYVELTNTGVITADLSGWWFSDGFDFTFPVGTLLPPGGYLVVAHDPSAVAGQYGLAPGKVLGPFEAKRLSNSGERVALRDAADEVMDEVTYSDHSPWPVEADGGGNSLELINPALENDQACSWAASDGQGTPGAQNSVHALDIPPCVENVRHAPLFPTSGQGVIVTARISDNGAITSAVVRHKNDADFYFTSLDMLDDGSGADAVAGDGVYTAQLPPYPDGSLVEYYIKVEDDGDLKTKMPSGSPGTTSAQTGGPVTIDYLFLVEDAPPISSRPIYRLLVTSENLTELATRNLYSNKLLDATFIYDGQIYPNVGLRYRGESTRSYDPKAYRVDFPASRLFGDVERLNLVSDNIEREALTYDLFRRDGMIASDTEFVDVYINADYQALYIAIEQVDEAFLAAHLPGDDTGNLYRAKDGGDLSYRGPNPDDYRAYYLKKSNRSADDYSDVIALTDALSNSSDESFQAAAEAKADMDQWLRWFALNAVVLNEEGALFRGRGDDYFLYHRPSDGRFILIPWDHDSTMLHADGSIWIPNLPIVQRILNHPPYTRKYYQNIVNLMADKFSVATMHPLIDALPSELDAHKSGLKQFVTDRIAYLNDYFATEAPDRSLAVTTNGGQSFITTQRVVTLEGECSPWRDVYVNASQEATYTSLYDWHYTTPPLRPRANRFVFTDRDGAGHVVTTRTITITLDAFAGGTLTQNLTLARDTSPHIILDDIVVPSGLTLTVEPGVTVLFAEGKSLFVEGRLLVEGTPERPITFTRDQESGYWGAIGVYNSTADNRLTHVRVEYAGQADYRGHTFRGVGTFSGQLTLEDSEIHHTGYSALNFDQSTGYVRRNTIHDIAGAGLRAQDSSVQVEDNLFHTLDEHGAHLSGSSDASVLRHNIIYGVQGDCVHLDGAGAFVERNELHHCTGAGVSTHHTASLTFTNNLIRHNDIGVAVQGGPGVHLAHNTLAYHNTAGLILHDPGSQATVLNSIVWDSGTPISYTTGASVTVSFSDVQGGWSGPGGGNIDADPQFRQPASAIFRLLETSPCVDQATPQGAVTLDLMGVPRPKGEGYDMGAFEFFEFYSVYLPLVADGS